MNSFNTSANYAQFMLIVILFLGVLSGHDDTESHGATIVKEGLDPLFLFECFMNYISWDVSTLIDFLISNETCFLLYFLR